MDLTKFNESQYLNADIVRNSPTKKVVILSQGAAVISEYNGITTEQFEVLIEIDGKQKKWKPNLDSRKNLSDAWTTESSNWIGKMAKVRVVSVMGKDSIIAQPAESK